MVESEGMVARIDIDLIDKLSREIIDRESKINSRQIAKLHHIANNSYAFAHTLFVAETANATIEIEGFATLVAPNMLGKVRIIDEWIAIMLMSIDSLVAINLFLRHRVLAMPCEHEIVEPIGERWIGVASEHIVLVKR